jgi:hypothetical protein
MQLVAREVAGEAATTGGERVSAREIEAVGGRAFELSKGAARDFVLARDAGASSCETARLASDFEWAWLRFGEDDETRPRELIAIGGRSLKLDGREILRAASRLNYFVARRAGGELIIETDAAGGDFALDLSGLRPDEEQKGMLKESES